MKASARAGGIDREEQPGLAPITVNARMHALRACMPGWVHKGIEKAAKRAYQINVQRDNKINETMGMGPIGLGIRV